MCQHQNKRSKAPLLRTLATSPGIWLLAIPLGILPEGLLALSILWSTSQPRFVNRTKCSSQLTSTRARHRQRRSYGPARR